MLYFSASPFINSEQAKAMERNAEKKIVFSTSKTKYKSDMIQLDIIRERSV